MIAQIQTCCEGLNLQHFAEVYFTTPNWNPAVEDQAIARAHRIGQKKEVDVYRFMTTFKEPTKNDTIRHHSKFESSVSLDEDDSRTSSLSLIELKRSSISFSISSI